jgi:DNA-directed RNA polymerase subunit RPC12/RpoP
LILVALFAPWPKPAILAALPRLALLSIERGRRPAVNERLMLIIFQCEHCGKRFQVDERSRGRRGRCSHCGHVMRIPKVLGGEPAQPVHGAEPRHELKTEFSAPPEHSRERNPSPQFRLSPPEPPPLFLPPVGISIESESVEPPHRSAPSPPVNAPRIVVGPHDSVFALQPVGPELLRHEAALGRTQFELLDDEEPGEAALASPEIQRAVRELAEFEKDRGGYSLAGQQNGLFRFFGLSNAGPASWVRVKWRKSVGIVLKALRFIDTWAYLISVPFLVLMIFGIVVEQSRFVHLGAVIVVLANYGRFWADLLAFFVRPYKDGPLQGVAFLFPPYTVYFLMRRWSAMKPILRRIVTSCIPIVLVVLVYAFLPFVNPAAEQAKTVTRKIESGKKVLDQEIDSDLQKLEGEILPRLERKLKRQVEP